MAGHRFTREEREARKQEWYAERARRTEQAARVVAPRSRKGRRKFTAADRVKAREYRLKWQRENPEAFKAALAKSRATYVAKYPDRVVTYEAAIRNPQPCDMCGKKGSPFFNLEPYALAGWRCYACRKKVDA